MVEASTCLTISGVPCEIPFVYDGNYYDTCINVDNGGVLWCYTNHETKNWDFCDVNTCSITEGISDHLISNHYEDLII